jgi:Protein of unknown function with HXXEE motif
VGSGGAGLADNPGVQPRGARQLHPVWLFPPTYLLHIGEEYLMCGGFPAWVADVLGIAFTNAEFVAWNALGMLLICVAAWLVSRHAHLRFIEIALAMVVLGNVAAHVLGSLVTWTYSPGLVTGVVVWTPLGWIRLRSAWGASTPKARQAGTYLGLSSIVMTVAVVALSR